MKCPPEVTCIVCQLVFCCGDCRWRHEQASHGLDFDCPLCRGLRFLCHPRPAPAFLHHLREHLPLYCAKCRQTFTSMEDLADIDKCTSLSELVDQNKTSLNVIDERFDSLYEKIIDGNEDLEALVSINKSNKTAVITPIIRKKYLVDYEASDTEPEDGEASPKVSFAGTAAPKTPRLKRSATPHVKKLLQMARQQALDEADEGRGSPDLDNTEPNRQEGNGVGSMTTPTSRLAALAAVTTSTPTHLPPAPAGGWALFSRQTDSPLSEIEQADSPQQADNRADGTDQAEEATEPSGASSREQPKLKSIMASRRGGSADSSERDDARAKRVKFARDTVFQPEPAVKRVFRKPKRMLTPGPTKARFCCNPRFQALINRFEQHAVARGGSVPAPPAPAPAPHTPPGAEPPSAPRAIDFKDSPAGEDAEPRDRRDNELFKSCLATPGAVGMDSAITALTTNIAGSLQTCISNVLKHSEEETEIQFKFTITKKKISVQRARPEATPPGRPGEATPGPPGEATPGPLREPGAGDKENLWASVAKAVKNAFWGEGGDFETPHKSISSCGSSSSKRKQEQRSVSPSPRSHKRGKFERLRGRPPLRSGLPLTARLARGDVTSHSF